MGLGIKIPKNVFAKGQEDLKNSPGYAEDVELSPGRYVCITQKARALDTSKGPRVILDLKVAGETDAAGGRVSLWYETSEDRIVHLFRDLVKLGYDVEGIDEKGLEKILEDINKTKVVVRISAKQNGEYVNLRLDKLMTDIEVADVDVPTKTTAAPAAEAEAEEEEVEEEAEAEEEVDPLLAMDRAALKKKLKELDAAFVVTKKQTDDELRAKIRELESAEEPEAEEEAEEEEAPPAADDSVELEVGMQVNCTSKNKQITGKVVEINETTGKVKVRDKAGTVHVVGAEAVELP